jgi:hypothetical protein
VKPRDLTNYARNGIENVGNIISSSLQFEQLEIKTHYKQLIEEQFYKHHISDNKQLLFIYNLRNMLHTSKFLTINISFQ